MEVDIISMSLGLKDEPSSVREALNEARRRGIIVLASASNEGANDTIAFPARLESVFCIGSADGKGSRSSFSPPFMGEEKYSTLGEAVLGAHLINDDNDDGNGETRIHSRRSGTSTAVVIAAGIVALLIDYTRQFMDLEEVPMIGIIFGKYLLQCRRRQRNNLIAIFLQNIYLVCPKTSKVLSNPF